MTKSIRVNTKSRRGRPPTTGKGTLVGIRLQASELDPLDKWIENQEPRPTRPEAIRRVLRNWLIGTGLLKAREDRSNLDQHIEHLESEIAI